MNKMNDTSAVVYGRGIFYIRRYCDSTISMEISVIILVESRSVVWYTVLRYPPYIGDR